MLQIRNAAALASPLAIPAGGAQVPFDTTIYRTNDAMELNSDHVDIRTPGVYHAACEISLQNTGDADVTINLQAYAGNEAIPGAIDAITLAPEAQGSLSLPWAVKVIPADNSTASISWRVFGGAVDLVNAHAVIWRLL